MGSRISGTSGTGMAQSQGISNWQQRQKSSSTLNSTLQSENLNAAQKSGHCLPIGTPDQRGA